VKVQIHYERGWSPKRVLATGETVSIEFDFSGPFAAPIGGYQLVWEKELNALTWPIALDVQLPGQPPHHWTSDLSVDRHFNAP
jgi:hypothetical protein